PSPCGIGAWPTRSRTRRSEAEMPGTLSISVPSRSKTRRSSSIGAISYREDSDRARPEGPALSEPAMSEPKDLPDPNDACHNQAMERVTLSVIKADVGGFVGHTGMHKDILKRPREFLDKARTKGTSIDHWVGHA